MTTKQQLIDCKTTVHPVPQQSPKNEQYLHHEQNLESDRETNRMDELDKTASAVTEHPTTTQIMSKSNPMTNNNKTIIKTRQSHQIHQQQGSPIQPFAVLDVFTGQRFLPQLPPITANQ